MVKKRVIETLKESAGDFVSGQMLSDELKVSRTSIWNYINALKEEGYDIESVTRKGHRLISSPDILTREEISEYLNTETMGKHIYYYSSIDSTNKLAKEIAIEEDEGSVVIAEEQTSGRGRLGREWTSPHRSGIWMSLIIKPNIEPMDASKITQLTAASVYSALSEMGIETKIKWPNDIVLNGKKVCGILTEMSSEMMQINYMVIGIGINVNLDKEAIPEEIVNKATSLKIETGKVVNRKELIGKILNYFEYFYNQFILNGNIEEAMEICKTESILIGKKIRVINRGTELERYAIDLTSNGELIVKDEEGNIETVISGEVSVRGEHGYV